MVPGALTRPRPARAASPERGWTNAATPAGTAIGMPVGSTARSPGSRCRSCAATMSAPASPGSAYTGSGRSASRRLTSTGSTGGNATLEGVTTSSDASHTVQYREALRAPWWWYAVAIFVAGLLAAEFHISSLALTDYLSFGILLPLSVVIVWSLGRGTLEISDGELRVRGAHTPLTEISGAVALDEL